MHDHDAHEFLYRNFKGYGTLYPCAGLIWPYNENALHLRNFSLLPQMRLITWMHDYALYQSKIWNPLPLCHGFGSLGGDIMEP